VAGSLTTTTGRERKRNFGAPTQLGTLPCFPSFLIPGLFGQNGGLLSAVPVGGILPPEVRT
jgi:hypothetical protein